MSKKLGGKKFFQWLGCLRAQTLWDTEARQRCRHLPKWARTACMSAYHAEVNAIHPPGSDIKKNFWHQISGGWVDSVRQRITIDSDAVGKIKYIGNDANMQQGLAAQIDEFNGKMTELKPTKPCRSARLEKKLKGV